MLFSTDRKVERGYVWASAITDIPHWEAFFYVLGWDGVSQWRSWHMPLWLQLGVPVFAMAFKAGYLFLACLVQIRFQEVRQLKTALEGRRSCEWKGNYLT